MDKSDLLGQAQKMKATGGYRPDPQRLKKPLKWEKGVVYCFCEGCDTIMEISQEVALELSQLVGQEPPSRWDHYYFEVNQCIFCTREEPFQVELKIQK